MQYVFFTTFVGLTNYDYNCRKQLILSLSYYFKICKWCTESTWLGEMGWWHILFVYAFLILFAVSLDTLTNDELILILLYFKDDSDWWNYSHYHNIIIWYVSDFKNM